MKKKTDKSIFQQRLEGEHWTTFCECCEQPVRSKTLQKAMGPQVVSNCRYHCRSRNSVTCDGMQL